LTLPGGLFPAPMSYLGTIQICKTESAARPHCGRAKQDDLKSIIAAQTNRARRAHPCARMFSSHRMFQTDL
jgi:hypothetical protein